MEAADDEGEGRQEAFENRQQATLADALDRTRERVLRHFIDYVEMIGSFDFIPVALMRRVRPQAARLALRPRPPRAAFQVTLQQSLLRLAQTPIGKSPQRPLDAP